MTAAFPLRLLVGVSGAVLLARAIFGPFHLITTVYNPLTAASVFGVAWMLAIAWRSNGGKAAKSAPPAWMIAAVLALVVLAFARAAPYFFISDDYLVLRNSREFTASQVPYLLTHVSDATFFRPIGDFSWYFEYRLSGMQPAAWHAVELAIHTINCALVYVLITAIFSSRAIGLWTAALFGLHPANLEAVCYLGGGQQILVASLFLLIALMLFVRRSTPWTLAVSLAAAWLALWSKESAFVLPVLVTIIAWRIGAPLRRTVPYWILTAAAFVYRWILLGGLGGYKQTHATLFGIAKVLAVRLWAILVVPLNWSTGMAVWTWIGLAAGIAAYLLLTAAAPARRDVAFALAWIVVCALPGIQMLLIGSNMLNSRLLYLSTIGFGLLLGCAIDTLPRTRVAVGLALVVFFFATIQHGLTIWSGTSELARHTCAAAAAGETAGKPPGEKNGVWLFANGFAECVALRRQGALR
jgi:hypothetical protein